MSFFTQVEAKFLTWLSTSEKYQTFGIYSEGEILYEIEVGKYTHDYVPPFGRLGKTLVLIGLEINKENQRQGQGTETCLRLWHHAQERGFENIHFQCANTKGAIALGKRLVQLHGWKEGGDEMNHEFVMRKSFC